MTLVRHPPLPYFFKETAAQARTADVDLEFLTRGVVLCSSKVRVCILKSLPSPSSISAISPRISFRMIGISCKPVLLFSASTSQRVIITRVMARCPAPIYSSLDLGEISFKALASFFFPISSTPSQLDLTTAATHLSLFQQGMANSYSSRKAPSYRSPCIIKSSQEARNCRKTG